MDDWWRRPSLTGHRWAAWCDPANDPTWPPSHLSSPPSDQTAPDNPAKIKPSKPSRAFFSSRSIQLRVSASTNQNDRTLVAGVVIGWVLETRRVCGEFHVWFDSHLLVDTNKRIKAFWLLNSSHSFAHLVLLPLLGRLIRSLITPDYAPKDTLRPGVFPCDYQSDFWYQVWSTVIHYGNICVGDHWLRSKLT